MEGPSPFQPAAPPERLDSWKEIGSYLGRDVRTVQRWERTRGLPVRRLPGGDMARVYALKPELDAWRNSRGIHLLQEAPPRAPAVGWSRRRAWLAIAAVVAVAAGLAALAVVLLLPGNVAAPRVSP